MVIFQYFTLLQHFDLMIRIVDWAETSELWHNHVYEIDTVLVWGCRLFRGNLYQILGVYQRLFL